jgi:hypothetical protein
MDVSQVQNLLSSCCLKAQGLKLQGKVKFTLEEAMKVQRGSRGIALLCSKLDTRWGQVVSAMHQPLCTQEETWYPFYRRLCRPQGHSRWARKIASPPGFDPPTVEAIVSHYINYAIIAHRLKHTKLQLCLLSYMGMNLMLEEEHWLGVISIQELGAEGNIWAYEGGCNRTVEKTA